MSAMAPSCVVQLEISGTIPSPFFHHGTSHAKLPLLTWGSESGSSKIGSGESQSKMDDN